MRGTTAAIRTRLGAGQAAPGPESRNRDALLAALACLALAMGVLVYLADREPSHAALIPSVQVLAASHLFGTLGQWLPSFVHPFAFSLLAAAALPPRMARRYGACAAWCAVNVLFEIKSPAQEIVCERAGRPRRAEPALQGVRQGGADLRVLSDLEQDIHRAPGRASAVAPRHPWR